MEPGRFGEQPEALTEKLHDSLQELIGLHRQLHEVVKAENEAITNADVKGTYDAAAAKEALVHWIHQAEMNRQTVVYTISQQENLDLPTLRQLILHFQSKDPDFSERLQTDLSSLIVLVERIQTQNRLNGSLIEKSLHHIHNMKKNIFGDINPTKTYNQQGQKNQATGASVGPRLISKEV